MSRAYRVLDVFTETPLAGNPLAVVLDAAGLDGPTMQAIAAEFNLSETVFVMAPDDPEHRARLRIFTPGRELPFAGHPTVGTAVCLALDDEVGTDRASGMTVEEQVGVIRCDVRLSSAHGGAASFALPVLPQRSGPAPAPELIASALGLALEDIGFADHQPAIWSAGVPFLLVPVTGRDAVDRAQVAPGRGVDLVAQAEAPGIFIYARARADVGASDVIYARMFAPGLGIAEDPATGAAVAALAGQIMVADRPADGAHVFQVEQGVAMGRPSKIQLELTVASGLLTGCC